jgi:plastocyanin
MKRTAIAIALLGAVLAFAASGSAATRVLKGTVGPAFTITISPKPTKAGTYKLVVADKSKAHNFHLIGPGVNVKTSVPFVGTKTFTIKLKEGTYRYVCDPHASFMKGSFKVT